MASHGIVLGHLISKKGIEVDPAKIDIIANLPYPTYVREVRSFLGHADTGIYHMFIKDFSNIALPMTTLLQKDVDFCFDDKCKKGFDKLKAALINAPIVQAFSCEIYDDEEGVKAPPIEMDSSAVGV
ncbi:uncharacterized mitochondrial protein AtMg00860-like [Benincasa hispida]|uniref:uncharacterized mitochondrial protein AtMg00860-like n=1 Tax=Benincasa hispida TaxID=102211 RepID=UPI00190062AC|nr:uncharacterized mitochondrial protein AtMg00860-like [Benincasa hispida]